MSDAQANLMEALATLAGAQARTQSQIEALAGAQRSTEEGLQRVEAQIEALALRMDRVEAQIEALVQRMDRVEAQIEALALRMDRVEAQIEALALRMDRVEAQIEKLVEQVAELVKGFGRLDSRVGQFIGKMLELEYRTKAPAYFGTLVRRAHVISHEDLDGLLDDAVDRGLLGDDERREVLLLDLVVQGRDSGSGETVHLAVEVSSAIGPEDVERAARRAQSFGRVVGRVLPIAAGEGIIPEAGKQADRLGVWQLLDGRPLAPRGNR